MNRFDIFCNLYHTTVSKIFTNKSFESGWESGQFHAQIRMVFTKLTTILVVPCCNENNIQSTIYFCTFYLCSKTHTNGIRSKLKVWGQTYKNFDKRKQNKRSLVCMNLQNKWGTTKTFAKKRLTPPPGPLAFSLVAINVTETCKPRVGFL